MYHNSSTIPRYLSTFPSHLIIISYYYILYTNTIHISNTYILYPIHISCAYYPLPYPLPHLQPYDPKSIQAIPGHISIHPAIAPYIHTQRHAQQQPINIQPFYYDIKLCSYVLCSHAIML